MKILLLNYEFPPLGGGAGNATKNIAREMVSLGYSVLVVTTWFSGLQDEEIIDGYKIIRLHSKRNRKDRSNIIEMLHFVWCAIKSSEKIIAEFKPDVVISFFAVPTGIVARYLKYKYNIPYTLSLRGGDVPGFLPKNLKYHHIISAPITNIVWRNSSSIVANSKGLKILAEKTASKFNKRVEYIPNGVNTKEFFPNPNKETSDKLNIIFVGRLTEQKGVTFLIKAIKELSNSNIYCNIIGDGPLRESLERQVIESKLQNNIKFLGWIAREKLPEYYQNADIFILPSYEEGMPNVILEAIASGLAIIATDIGGNDELIINEVNGFLYKDHSELSGLIQKFIDNPLLKKDFGNESAKKSLEFSWKLVAEKYIDICQKIN